MQLSGYGLPRTPLSRTPVNKGKSRYRLLQFIENSSLQITVIIVESSCVS
jgi:hypothetical protein